MKHLKNRIHDDLEKLEAEIEKKGDYNEKQLQHLFILTQTYLNLDKMCPDGRVIEDVHPIGGTSHSVMNNPYNY